MGDGPLVVRLGARAALTARLGPGRAAAIVRCAKRRYSPPPDLAVTASGRLNLRMAAYLLALRDAMNELGADPASVDADLARDLFRVMRVVYRPVDGVARLLHPRNRRSRAAWRQRLAARMFFKAPDWDMRHVDGGSGYAFDVRRCVLAEYMESRGETAFCRDVICAQDLMMARARGEDLVRPQTIAGGADTCTFRFQESH